MKECNLLRNNQDKLRLQRLYFKSTKAKHLPQLLHIALYIALMIKLDEMRAVTDEKPLFVIFNYESKSKFGAERLMYPISAGFPFRFVSSK